MNGGQLKELKGYRKERPLVLGQHTAISIAKESGKWKDIPYLKENEGMMPPNLIVVGDRRRVLTSVGLLKEYVLLDKVPSLIGESEKSTLLKATLKSCVSRISRNPELSELAGFLSEQYSFQQKGEEIQPLVFVGRLLNRFDSPLSDKKSFDELELIVREVMAISAGRVNVALGIYEHDGLDLPLTILETQMGMSAQDINAWEALVNSREDGYIVNGIPVPAKGINVIRAGTCGGIIISKHGLGQTEAPIIDIGDQIIASASIADGAVARQRMGIWSAMDKKDLRKFQELWIQEGFEFTEDGNWPVIQSSRAIIDALSLASSELGLKVHHGANSSKESLYMEGDEERVKALRSLYFALSTEMEHFGLAFLAHELSKTGLTVQNGLISTVVGTIPGGSFATSGSPEEKKANESQERMLEATMRALWKMTYEA